MARIANKKTASTQKHLIISEIRDNCVIMKDGTLRAVLLTSSVNFALKSEDEQNAIVGGYVSFLNSLEAPIQILVQSRKLDLERYLESIKEMEVKQTNELLKLQTAEYRQYITQLVELGDIMTKRFYIVVSYNPDSDGLRSFWSRVGDVMSPAKIIGLSHKQFIKYHKELFVRVDKVLGGLSGMGLRASILDTQSLIELYYNTYNQSIAKREKMVDVGKLNLE